MHFSHAIGRQLLDDMSAGRSRANSAGVDELKAFVESPTTATWLCENGME